MAVLKTVQESAVYLTHFSDVNAIYVMFSVTRPIMCTAILVLILKGIQSIFNSFIYHSRVMKQEGAKVLLHADQVKNPFNLLRIR